MYRYAPYFSNRDHTCTYNIILSKIQWKPFWLATQLHPQGEWTRWQNGVNYDIFVQASSIQWPSIVFCLLFLFTGQGLSPEEIRDEADTFLFEGHDTTASALQWAIYYIAKHPDVQRRCREEAREILGNSDELSLETIGKLQYITQVVKETVRSATTVPFVYRQLTKDTTVDGFLLTEGTWVAVSLYGVHHHPEFWPDPYEFRPSRFEAGANADKGSTLPFAFVPFSGGPRNCIGQGLAMEELKATIALLLREFELSVPEDMEDVEPHLYLVTRPSKPIFLDISKAAWARDRACVVVCLLFVCLSECWEWVKGLLDSLGTLNNYFSICRCVWKKSHSCLFVCLFVCCCCCFQWITKQ